MTVEEQFILAIYAIVVTIGLAATVYSLVLAKRTVKALGLIAEARLVMAVDASVKRVLDEADAIVEVAKAKTKAAPRKRAPAAKKVVAAPRKAK